jgi:ABC-type transport system involved in multi-copper enzyme maturation permease subunit
MLGIVALVIWAGSAASDYSTGLIRLLVQAEPSRIRLLAGKILALTVFTCVATLVATMAITAVAPVVAESAGVSTDAWSQDVATMVFRSYLQLTLSVLLWGILGLFVGVATRSTGIAVAVGVGYLLVFEGLLGMVLDSGSRWLPGSAFSAVAAGGSADMGFGTALLVAAVYAVAAVGVSAVVVRRRDITA